MRFGKGPVLLFLHGAILRVQMFLPVLRELAKDYTIIAPNLPGHGMSEPLNKMDSLEVISHHIEDFLDIVGISPRYIAGYSLGGGIGLYLASRLKKIKRVIVADPFIRPITHSIKDFLRCSLIDIPKYWLDHKGDKSTFAELLKESMGNIWELKGEIPKVYKDLLYLYSNNKVETKDLRVKTMLLWGSDDQLFSSSLAKELAKENHKISYEVIEGDHAWPMMHPEVFTERIKTFCKTGILGF